MGRVEIQEGTEQGGHQDDNITKVEGAGDSVDISGRGDRKQRGQIPPDISPT